MNLKILIQIYNQSLILKLYNPLPTSISNLKLVTIEKEILTTQVEDIFYFSDVPSVFFGDGLIPLPRDAENEVTNFEPTFKYKWHAKAWAITLAAGALGEWNLDISRHYRECLPPKDYKNFSYYKNSEIFSLISKAFSNIIM